MSELPPVRSLPIAVRAFAKRTETAKGKGTGGRPKRDIGHSEWTLIFDTETTTDAPQQLRFGCYQVRQAGIYREAGLFYDPAFLTSEETALLHDYADANGLYVMTVTEFVETVFFYYAYGLNALCVGFNLPFDLSRIAIHHVLARRKMKGGFSFTLSRDTRRPNVQVKHLNSRAAVKQFTIPGKQDTPNSQRKRGNSVAANRGYFVDVKTLASALLSDSWSLGTLSQHLDTEHKKQETDEHGKAVTVEYLDYALQDVQATWECFERLQSLYLTYGLNNTPINQVYSEAGIGKAYLKEMGVRPFREQQPDFPSELLGRIMSAYYGGRSEIHLRRMITQVAYCDFLSMYPTACVLQNLWRFVTAQRLEWEDATEPTREFLETVCLEYLRQPEAWKELTTLVRILPDGDILPVRAKYDDKHYVIGLNYLSSKEPLWYTLADCVASKVLTGRVPKIVEAIRFSPSGVQAELQPITVAGNPSYRVAPVQEDFYRRLIDLRTDVKKRRQDCATEERERLQTEQNALKITANATSYGIFMELNVTALEQAEEVTCYGYNHDPFGVRVRNVEEAGRYFHPLLSTLITGAARLMLAIAERLAEEKGISWAFCDTDSMAFARPEGMSEADFLAKVEEVRQWFTPLNPYTVKEPLLKLETENFGLRKGVPSDRLEPLYCFAVSAKRYVLFNLDKKGHPILRKASAHGLGHLIAPYGNETATPGIPAPIAGLGSIGVGRWQHDVWYRVILAAQGETVEQVRLNDLAAFDTPAVSRYAVNTPALLDWFKTYNEGRIYREQVKPFNFLYAFQTKADQACLIADNPRVVAPFGEAEFYCFDRETGEVIPPDRLKTYRDTLAQYHLHPEMKFSNGDYTDRGVMKRRYIQASEVEHIGKEANRWEERFHLGEDPEAQIVYGVSTEVLAREKEQIQRDSWEYPIRELARATGLDPALLSRTRRKQASHRPQTLIKLREGVNQLEREHQQKADLLQCVREICQTIGLRQFALQAELDAANLSHVLKGQRNLSKSMIAKLQTKVQAYWQPVAKE